MLHLAAALRAEPFFQYVLYNLPSLCFRGPEKETIKTAAVNEPRRQADLGVFSGVPVIDPAFETFINFFSLIFLCET